MIITIASPDKINIAMFMSFMKFCLGKVYKIGTLHSLMSKEEIESSVKGFTDISDKLIFSYYAKHKINVDPVKVIPEKLISVSNMVIWMNLYSVDWVIVKDDATQASYYLNRWKANMDKFNSNL